MDGRGFHVRRYSGAGVDSLPVRGGGAWLWAGSIRNIRGAVEVIAEGLTEAECRHLSSLTAADALAWCEARDNLENAFVLLAGLEHDHGASA